MGRTGIYGQPYKRSPSCHFAPAFLRKLAPDDEQAALAMRIDQIKELKLDAIQGAFSQGKSWVLCRKNDNEGVVEQHTLDHMSELMSQV